MSTIEIDVLLGTISLYTSCNGPGWGLSLVQGKMAARNHGEPIMSSNQSAIDFHLRIETRNPGRYIVHTPSTGVLPYASTSFSAASFKRQSQPLAKALIDGEPFSEKDLQKLGILNFETLFGGEIRECYRSLQASVQTGQRLRIFLDIQPTALRSMPWEVLYDPWLKRYIGEQDSTTVIRYSPASQTHAEKVGSASTGIRILVIASQPRNAPTIYADQEIERLKEVVKNEIRQDLLTFDYCSGTLDEIRQGLATEPDVVHFIGHGGIQDGLPGIYFVDTDGLAEFANESYLESQILIPERNHLQRLRLIVLNACSTSAITEELDASLADALAPWAGSVVAMQYPIADKASRLFSAAFYQALAQSQPLDIAVASARLSIRKGDPNDQRGWLTPVLISSHASFTIQRLLNPFKGAQPYTQADRYQFLGRTQPVEALLGIISGRPVSVISGPSCSGKTSLLQAGLIPQLEHTRPCFLLTASDSLENQLVDRLNAYLLAQNQPSCSDTLFSKVWKRFPDDLAIVIDRAEQASLLGERTQEILRELVTWANHSLASGGSGKLVLAIRAEPDDPLPEFWTQLVPGMSTCTFKLPPLDRDQMAEVVTETGNSAGIRFQRDAVTRILGELNYEEEPRMMHVQVVCHALYRYAREKCVAEINKEMLSVDPPGGVTGILKSDFDVSYRLSQVEASASSLGRQILVQFLRSEPGRSRRVEADLLLLRLGNPEGARSILERLEEDGILVSTGERGQQIYELAHETLCLQIEKFKEADPKLRRLEEILEGAGEGLLPAQGKSGCLSDLREARDNGSLVVSDKQKAMLLRSALESGFEVRAWRQFAGGSAEATLSNPDLGTAARARAAIELADIALQHNGTVSQAVLGMAFSDRDPDVRRTASRAAAGVVSPTQVAEAARAEETEAKTVTSLAYLYARNGSLLTQLEPELRKRARGGLLRLRSASLLANAALAAGLGATAFAFAAVFNWYNTTLSRSDATNLDWVTLIPLALLAFFLALPGSALPLLGREVFSVYLGQFRRQAEPVGLVLGSICGMALTLFLSSILSQLGSSEGYNLLPTLGGALLGGVLGCAVTLAEIASNRIPMLRHWLSAITCAVVGGGTAYFIQRVLEWWGDGSTLLTPKFLIHWLVLGGVIGLMFALSLRRRAVEYP